MRRLGKWLLNALTMLSLLLCTASALLWAAPARSGSRRSIQHVSVASDRAEVTMWCASAWNGRLKIFRLVQHWRNRTEFDDQMRRPWVPPGWSASGVDLTFNWGIQPSFSIDDNRVDFGSMTQHVAGVTVPLWFACLITGALPLLRVGALVRRLVRKMQPARGLCPCCRYDLTGNVSGVCPECGTPMRAQAPSAQPSGVTGA